MEFKEFTAKPARLEIDPDDPRKVYVEISEGKYHQVKRMCERAGKTVLFLKRVAIGKLALDETLECGKVRELTKEELALFGGKHTRKYFYFPENTPFLRILVCIIPYWLYIIP